MINLDNSIFNIKQPSIEPAAGRLLVAEPFLREQYFSHSVILLLDYNEPGTAMGLVLNNKTQYTLGELVEGVADDVDVPVYCGGPVGSDRLFYLHRLGDIFDDSQQVAPGLWVGGDFDQVMEYIADGNPVEGVLRFFLGYSGWEPRQLIGEVEQHVWAVARISRDMDILRGSEDSYWHRTVRTLGRDYAGWRYHPAQLIAN